ncbi:MAG TPA: GldG family protein [Bacteriovoracaceae bacterium]|nr:GldG family protein [Bacteriovoracaceae bacterium]
MKSWLFPLWVIIDVLIFLVVIALWITAPEYLTLNIGLTIFAGSLALILGFIKINSIKAFVKTSYFRKASYHVLNSLLVIMIICLVNYMGNKNYKEFDVTAEKRNSLTGQTLRVLDMIKEPVKLTIYSKREEWTPILNLLKLYEAASKHIKLEAIDTDLRPDLVKSKGITQNGTIIIEHKGKESLFQITDELSVTNALLKTLRTEKIVLYFVTGHKELTCNEKGQEGISQICQLLVGQNYEIRELNLTATTEVPADANAVFVLGPTSGFLKNEIDQLRKYLLKGGSMFLALAPAFKAELYDDLIKLAEPYGLTMGKDIVVDRLSTVQGAEATIPIINNYEANHPITAGFTQRTVFPLSSSIQTVPGKDGAILLAFTSSFPGSWAESDLKGVTEGKATYNEKTDRKGPVALLGIGESTETTKGSRFAMMGSSSFLVNAYQNQSANSTLFLNTVSWMVDDEGIISFNRPGIEEYPVILSAQHIQMIFVISIMLVPILFFGTAIFIYRRRRLL